MTVIKSINVVSISYVSAMAGTEGAAQSKRRAVDTWTQLSFILLLHCSRLNLLIIYTNICAQCIPLNVRSSVSSTVISHSK